MAGIFNLKCSTWSVLTANFQWHMCDKGGKNATEKAGEGQEASILGVNIVRIVYDHAEGYCTCSLGITFFFFS